MVSSERIKNGLKLGEGVYELVEQVSGRGTVKTMSSDKNIEERRVGWRQGQLWKPFSGCLND